MLSNGNLLGTNTDDWPVGTFELATVFAGDAMKCRRCGHERTGAVSSMFDGELICNACNQREKEHPKYNSAINALKNAVNNGNYRYCGVGLPEDLRIERSV